MSSSKTDIPFFSVVIPTYNRVDLIFETLATVFAQTYTNYEVIIVDNASTDDTVEKLQELVKQKKVRLIVNPENVERARARNIGMKAAKGDYLTLFDSDDFMYENNLQDAADYIQKNPNQHFFHNHYELVNSKREHLNSFRFPSESQQIKRLAKGNFISCIGVFISKEIYTNFFFSEDENVLGSEDWELWMRVISNYKLGVIPKVNSAIRFHEGRSLSAYDLNKVIERKIYIIDLLLKDKKVKSVFGKYEKDMKAAVYVFVAINANEKGQYELAKKYLKKALSIKTKLILDPHFIRVAQIANFKLSKKYLKS